MTRKKTRILVLGSKGRLAGSLVHCWSGSHEMTALARPAIDVADWRSLPRQLDRMECDILMNGTGLTNVDLCESAREEARDVNAIAPGILAEWASGRGARLVHFSTDYVFDGDKSTAYDEEDVPSPLGWYGATKLEGERRVLACDSRHVVARVSWVFGEAKASFVDALIERALRQESVEAISDKFSCPTSAGDCAEWLEFFFAPSSPGGLFHLCNTGACSWRDYGEKALEFALDAGLPLRTTAVRAIQLADMKQFIAPRPVFSILSTHKLAATTGIKPRHWHEALRDYILKKYASIPSPA
ncbi:MAG: dTDP-4-dehydrorhamnose reductase [bacterium]